MPRGPSARTGTLWRKRLERFSRSGLSVAQFCSREGVSTSSLYNWRRKLELRTARRRKSQSRPAAPGAEPRDGSFQPVTVLPATPSVVPTAPAVVSAACHVSIQLPCGTRIDVRAENLDAVRAVVAEVARVDRRPEVKLSALPGRPYPKEAGGVASC